MKKILLGLSAITMLFATSCQNDLDFGTTAEKTSTVTFSVGTPEIATRAYSDGATATVLQYAVYDAAGNELTDLTVTDGEIHGSTTVNLQLTTGNSYSVIFWAAAEGAPYTVDFATKTMTVDYTAAVSNDEKRDAFYKYHTFTVTGAQTETIELKRPFAQLNIGTADYAASTSAGYTPTHSAVTVKKIYNTLNLATGAVENEAAVEYASAAIPAGETFPVAGYEYLAMNYLLVAAEKALVEIEFTYTDGSNAKTRTVGSVPVQRNYRTNIYGKLLTSDVDINVEINPVYDGEYNNEGYFIDNNLVYVESANGLATIAAKINDGTLPNNTNIVLEGDIDLSTLALTRAASASNWTPIGTSEKPFTGTFDGKGYTIKNLVADGGSNSYIGLFGVTMNGEIKNVTIENAKVSGYLGIGVVAGQPYTSKYTNITVKGHVEVNGFAYVGGVGGRNAYANWENITVDVDETSYVKAHSISEDGTAYRTYVGGVVGFNGEGGHSFKNITSNIDVKGSTIDAGGLFGIAHYGNKFENCVCTGDVEIYAANEEADAQEIGGIAGVWHPGGGDIVMDKCSFTGTLKANNDYVIDVTKFGNLVCAAYNTTGKGKLIIDGKYYSAAEETKTPVEATAGALQEALANGEDVLLIGNVAIAKSEGESNAYGATGINVLNGQTIDGGGNSISVNAWSTWDSAISTTGGVIKNIKVTGGMRGIFVNHNSDHSEKVILQNVTIDGTVYTISCDQGTNQGLEAYNSTFNGWTSYAGTIGNVYFENCSFGKGQGYKFCRPYAPTEFVGCNFCEGYQIDARAAVTFKNCTLNGVPVTSANLATLVTSNIANATVK